MNKIPATIDLNPSGDKAGASVIWLHGLGADGNDFVPIVDQLGLTEKHKIRFVFPHAPVRPITINGGMKMRAWYDIYNLDLARKEDSEGVQQSAHLIELLIERERSFDIPSRSIILAGFSQGGAMALYTGLRYKESLGGIVSLSAYLPLADNFASDASSNHFSHNLNTPIFMAHGLFDPIVPLMLGELARHQLTNLGYGIEWHSYPMPHTVVPEEIQDIGNFLKKIKLG